MNWNRNAVIWTAFGLCACLVVGAMTWLTRGVVHTERDRAEAEARAGLQERFRLSLWRMDAFGAKLLREENAVSTPLFTLERSSGLPVLSRFESNHGSVLLCTGEESARELVLKEIPRLQPPLVGVEGWQAPVFQANAAPSQAQLRGDESAQEVANVLERASREKLVDSNPTGSYATTAAQTFNPTGELKSVWVDESLFLVCRSLSLSGFIQGLLVDDKVLAAMLLEESAPLLPSADEMIPRPILISVSAGWLAVLAAMLAAFFLIASVMKLSERRASFVSAVTHELRTPLTTFRLYSDMLGAGAVPEAKRGRYLEVLSREADRLSHLVENVLAFSRIEKGSARSNVREVELGALLEEMRDRFETRLASGGLLLEIHGGPPTTFHVDTSALEHVLFNLIDNATKYASGSVPPLVIIETEKCGQEIKIRVRDHGPGIAESERKRIFQAFHKSAQAAAESKPGVGLGLALSKRLVAEMGGSLSCRPPSPDGGAMFVVSLPSK